MQVGTNFNSNLSWGCGDFQIVTKEKHSIYGRSMEFPMHMDSEIVFYPVGKEYSSTTPTFETGLKWVSKYGFVGITVFEGKGPVEGMNKKGLCYGVLSLLCSEYQTVDENQKEQALAMSDVGTWMLGNFATVQEVKEAIGSVRIWGDEIKALNSVPGLHIVVHDEEGNNLVIEFIKGEVKLHDNPIGVLTNDPPFEWHIQNLSLYNNLNPEPTSSVNIHNFNIPPISLSGDMKGIPGDWSSISRFVRIAQIVRFILPSETDIDGVIAATHILNTTDIPKGLVIAQLGDTKLYETTLWCTIKDVANKIFYYRSYNDMTLHDLNLDKIDFSIEYMPIKLQAAKPTVIHMTEKLMMKIDN